MVLKCGTTSVGDCVVFHMLQWFLYLTTKFLLGKEENKINSVTSLTVTIHRRNTFIMNQSVSGHIESTPALSSNHFRGMSDVF